MRTPFPPMRLQPAGCCRTVDLAGVPGAQSSREGTFSQVDGVVGQGGRPVYRNELNNQFLYFWAEHNFWLVGPDYEVNHAGIHSTTEDALCPNEATGWEAYVDSEWVADDSITVSCSATSALILATLCLIPEPRAAAAAVISGTFGSTHSSPKQPTP